MLSAQEFTVGSLQDAQPVSLILPRTEHEEIFLIGWTNNEPMAVVLSGQYRFHSFKCAGAQSWRGLIVPNVRVEVDEKSVSDSNSVRSTIGSVIRQDTHLILAAHPPHSFRPVEIILENSLSPTAHALQAAFSRWQVVLGEKENKRVLTIIDVAKTVMP
jgi:hypothetical protein